LRIVPDINKRPRRWEARAKLQEEERAAPKKPGPAPIDIVEFITAYLREYRAGILKSAGWTGTSMRLTRSAYEKQREK
jgi:hypothetical protein